MLDGLPGIMFYFFVVYTLCIIGIILLIISFIYIKRKLGKVLLVLALVCLIPFIDLKVRDIRHEIWKWDELGPLLHAIEKNKYDKVKQLIAEGHDVNEERIYLYAYTPLTSAVDKENMHIVQLLVENGADVNINPHNKMMPLGVAISKNNAAISAYLLEHGADINKTEEESSTPPFEYATVIFSDSIDVVEVLLKHGADVNNNNGAPLKGAISHKNDEVVRCLLEHGANTDNLPEMKSLAQSRFNYLYGSDSKRHEDSLKLVRIIELLDEYPDGGYGENNQD